ncbi:MAG TPA: M1 family aminopeptidase [Gemmatimonadaceae bacterium]
MHIPSMTPSSRLIGLAVVLCALTSPLAAQRSNAASPLNPNLERMTNDQYTRSHDYDLVHQRISVSDFDWDSTSFKGSVTTTVIALRPHMDSVVLDAGALLDIRAVRSSSGATLRQSHRGDTLVVYLARPVAFGDSVSFAIDYDGKVSNGRGLTFIDERPHTPRQIWSQGEDMNNHFWFPTYDFPSDKMTWELEATVPAGFIAVSNGMIWGDKSTATTRTMRWRQDKPSATYLVSLIVAPLAKVHDAWHGIPVDYYVYRQDSALARPLFRVTPDMIGVYSRLTGLNYPWAKYAQTTVADFFGGMENVSATTLVDWLPDARAYQDRPWYQYILIPHELAHQWFGDYVTTENWANTWLNEGFAEFMPGQYWATKLGPHAEQDYYVDEYRQYMGIESRRPMPLASMGSNNIYPKGALVLEMLKHHLGNERFWAGIHEYLVEHAAGDAVTDDLRQAFLHATGENLDWFWNEWMYSAGYPSITVTPEYDGAQHRLTLVARQTQRDSLRPDSAGMRYVIPEAFRMPLTIRVGTTSGDVSKRVWLRQRADTITIDSLDSEPTMLVFDEHNEVLKSLTLDEPTPWLATALPREHDLWNRQWIIQQLASRRSDAAAAAALATAATSADYYLTRQQAVAALGGFAREVAGPALAGAARDTSSAVRAAAVGALAQLGGDEALALTRAAWERDPSYTVRAAALGALARLDTANRRAILTQGLSTPSYQDVIQNAALRVIATTGDTSFAPQVQAIVGDQQLAARVLAVLAIRSSAAEDLVVKNLNDSRWWVRRWTVAGITGNMEPTHALALLRQIQAQLTFEDTKRDVARAIAQLEKRVP